MLRFFVGGDGRLRAGWRLVVQYAAYEYSRTILLTLLVVSLSAGLGLGIGTPSSSSFAYALIYLVSLGTALLTVWLAGRILDRRPFVDFGFHFGGAWWADFAFGLGLGAALMSAVFCVQLASGWVTVTEWFASPGIGFLIGLVPPVTIYLCTGVSEELVSRGYQLRNGAEGLAGMGMSPRAAVLLAWALSSVFFGLLHAANPNATAFSILNIALAGLMLGAGYVLTGELAIPIGLHISWNLFQGNVFGFPVSGIRSGGSSILAVQENGPSLWTGGPFGPEGGLLGTVAIVTGCALVILYVRLRRGQAGIEPSIATAPSPNPRPGSPPPRAP